MTRSLCVFSPPTLGYPAPSPKTRMGTWPRRGRADDGVAGRSHFQIKYQNSYIKTRRVIIFPVIGDPMKFTKIITYFLFHWLVFTSSTDICKMAAYCFLGCPFLALLLFNSCFIFTYKTSLSQTHKPYFKHNSLLD